MKKITILLVLLFTLTFSYSQLIYVEGFGGNVLPSDWTMNNIGQGTQLWTFGSGVVPGNGTNGVDAFSSSAAIFNDDAAGNTGNRDNVVLWTGGDSNGFNFSIYPDGIVTLSYEYALNILNGGNETLSVVIWDNANAQWITLIEYDTDANPTLDSVNLTAAINTHSGIDPSNVFIGFEYDDVDGGFAWGAGIDTVRLRVSPINDNCWTATNVTNDLPYQDITRTSGNTNGTNNTGYVAPAGCGLGMNNGLWYTFMSEIDGEFNIESLTPDFDHEIGVYRVGDCFNPAAFICVDNADVGFSGEPEALSFNVVAGVQYFINIGYYSYNSYLQTSGDLEINMFYTPTNNECIDAEIITDGATKTGTTIGATDMDGLLQCGAGGGDGSCTDGGTGFTNFGLGVWYKYTSTSTETITISTANVGTDYDTELQVWSGAACGTLLTCVGGDDDGGDGAGHASDSQFCWQSTGSNSNPEDYYIYVDGHGTNVGNFVLTLNADQSTASTEDFEQFSFSIYPNPVNNILSIDSQEIINKVSIFNLLGQEVKTSNPETDNVSVDVNNLDSGVYIIKLVAGDKKSTKKFVKQ